MIKIIQGTFGLKNGNAIIPKTAKDEPFSCDKATEKRLVDAGVAEYVEAVEAETEAAAEGENKEVLYTDETSLAELKEIAKKLGATEEALKPLRAKAQVKEVIDALAETYEAESEEIVEDEEAPVFNETDGVVQ